MKRLLLKTAVVKCQKRCEALADYMNTKFSNEVDDGTYEEMNNTLKTGLVNACGKEGFVGIMNKPLREGIEGGLCPLPVKKIASTNIRKYKDNELKGARKFFKENLEQSKEPVDRYLLSMIEAEIFRRSPKYTGFYKIITLFVYLKTLIMTKIMKTRNTIPIELARTLGSTKKV